VIARFADGRRLVTIVGPGGIGKTSLARAARRRLGDDTGGTVPVVELARIRAT